MTAGPVTDLIAEQDAILARVVAFIHQGMRNGQITDESGEALITAAERQRDEAVAALRD